MSNIKNLTVDQGTSFDVLFTLSAENGSAFDLTGYDARLQVRKAFSSTSTEINATLANSMLEIVNAANGQLVWHIRPGDTSPIRFLNANDDQLECVYDLEIQSPTAQVYKPARGTLTLNREVTR